MKNEGRPTYAKKSFLGGEIFSNRDSVRKSNLVPRVFSLALGTRFSASPSKLMEGTGYETRQTSNGPSMGPLQDLVT